MVIGSPRTKGGGWRESLALQFFRLAPALRIPPGWFQPGVPEMVAALPARRGRLKLEIVSHCWNYAHLLAYQLSSLVLAPPKGMSVRMTVCHCSEDKGTGALLDFFAAQAVPGVTWNWMGLRREELMRRAIGRNRAALATDADWLWFTDCDLVFHDGCLSRLGEILQGRADALLFPREERCTRMLAAGDELLRAAAEKPRLVAIDASRFEAEQRSRATGPLQIVHGDLARELGYCAALRCYQSPTERWRKTYEDRAFRWLLQNDGRGIDLPGVYRIKHIAKGRYHGPGLVTRLRSGIRRLRQPHS